MVLAMLLEEPMHAYRMQKLIKQRGKDKVVNVRQRASVYQAIERLLRLGLIAIRETVQTESHPDRTVYVITRRGRGTAKAWLRGTLTTVGADFPEFPAGVSVLAMVPPAEAQKQLEIRAAAVRQELSKLSEERREARDVPRLFLLEDEYRAALLESELAWLDSVIADLDSGALAWNKQWLKEIAAKFTPQEADSGPMTAPRERRHLSTAGHR
jgi:DNA-binding PadR family transcriptional regulator